MAALREYTIDDARAVGKLIKDTYSEFNLDFLKHGERAPFLGPFAFADDPSPAQLEDLDRVIRSAIVLLAVDDRDVVGVLRGRVGRLGSLFVARARQSQGIGSALVDRFENWIRIQGGGVIKVASSIHAIPFYLRHGYKRSTGIRKSWSFAGYGLPIQPMRKVIS